MENNVSFDVIEKWLCGNTYPLGITGENFFFGRLLNLFECVAAIRCKRIQDWLFPQNDSSCSIHVGLDNDSKAKGVASDGGRDATQQKISEYNQCY